MQTAPAANPLMMRPRRRVFELHNHIHVRVGIERFQLFRELAASCQQRARQECGPKKSECLFHLSRRPLVGGSHLSFEMQLPDHVLRICLCLSIESLPAYAAGPGHETICSRGGVGDNLTHPWLPEQGGKKFAAWARVRRSWIRITSARMGWPQECHGRGERRPDCPPQ